MHFRNLMTALLYSHGCGQLQSISLSRCGKVTDAGVSALGAGCGQQYRSGVERVTSVIASYA